MKSTLFFIVLLATSTIISAEENVLYIQSAKAKLMTEPSFSATVVTELERGTELIALKSQKRWLKVQAGEQRGWISSFLLSGNPPLKKVTVLSGEKKKGIEDGARRRASAVTTAGAVRGLSADVRKRADKHDNADFYALEQVEDYKVSSAEVTKFAKEGQLK